MRLDVLAVHNAGDGGDVEPRLLGDILEHHRLQVRVVTVDKIVVLVVENGRHRALQRVVPLLERFHEPLGGVELLLDEGRRLLLLPVGGTLGLLQHLGVAPVDADLGDVEAGHRKLERPVDDLKLEVRDDLLRLVVVRVIDLGAR